MTLLPSIPFASGGGVTPATARRRLRDKRPGTPDLVNWSNMGVGSGNGLSFHPDTRSPPFALAKTDSRRDVLITHPLDLTYFASAADNGWDARFRKDEGVILTREIPPQSPPVGWHESIILHLPFGIRGGGMQFDIQPLSDSPSTEFTAHVISRHRNFVDTMETKALGSIRLGQPRGSAVFVGLCSTANAADFLTLEVWVTSGNHFQLDFAINQVTLLR